MSPLDSPRLVTFLMPCLNEELTLPSCIKEAFEVLDKCFSHDRTKYEVLIADNGSTDASVSIAVALGARVVAVKQKGYGNAIKGGLSAARGKYIIMADSDLSYAFTSAPEIISALEAGADLVMGNRFSGKIDDGAMPFLHRYLGNPVLSFLGRLFYNIPVRDFHCGIRGFRRDSILALNLQTTGMEYASEMVVRSSLASLRITQVPAHLRRDGRDRPPHLKTWRDGWRHLKFLLLLCPTALLIVPGSIMAILGWFVSLCLSTLTSPPALTTSPYLAVSAALLAVAGFQLLLTGLFAREILRVSGFFPILSSRPTLGDVTTEHGVAGGAALCLGGFLSLSLSWVDGLPQMAIPSLVTVLCGIELALTSFLIAVAVFIKEKVSVPNE